MAIPAPYPFAGKSWPIMLLIFFLYTFYYSCFVVTGSLFSHFSLAAQKKIRSFETNSVHFSDDAPSHTERERKRERQMASTSLIVKKQKNKHILDDLGPVLCIIFTFLCQDLDFKFL